MKYSRFFRAIFVAALAVQSTHTTFGFRAEEDVVSSLAIASSAPEEKASVAPTQAQIAAADAAKSDKLDIQWSDSTGTPASVRGADLAKQGSFSGVRTLAAQSGATLQDRAVGVLDNLSKIYGIQDAASEFQAGPKIDTDELGFNHVRVNQVYNGLRVVGGDLRVHFNSAGTAYQVTGSYVKDVALEMAAKLTADDAVAAAQSALAASGIPLAKLVTPPELVVYALDRSAPVLAYEMLLQGDSAAKGVQAFRCWINARNGSLLNAVSEIKRIAAPTTNGAATTISGNLLAGEGGGSVNISGWRENTGSYYLYNKTNLWFIFNVASSGWTDAGTYAYRSAAAWSTSDRVEISAARNMNVVQDYFRTVHGRNSVDGLGMYAEADIHYGTNYVNAYWDGYKMVFGDGNGVQANSLAVLDVTGHEVTHGVTQHTANLVYQNESGALNESFSDIFGAIIEFYGQTDGRASYPNVTLGTADWLMGEDCWISAKALRDMKNPSSTVTLTYGSQQPSRYKGTYWYFGSGDYGGVHTNSGPQNFFFYLLCDGGSGTNDGTSYSVTGIGINNARLVAYRALTVYCTSSTDYAGARNAWISAAQDLNASWVPSVQAAWNAVGVAAAAPTVASPTFTPPAGSYQSAVSVSISSATAGATIRYTVDGTEPTTLSPIYSTALSVSADTTIKAKAFMTGYQASATVTSAYQFLGTLLYNFPMDTSPGWTTSGLWAFGRPTGSGGSHGSPDPTGGHTGTNVYGYNLSGDYENSLGATQWLTTTALNLASASNVKLAFWRWLGVESPSYDHAYIEVSNNGSTWTRVWSNTTEVADSQWTFVSYDISAVADRQSTVFIRWGLGSTDSSWTFCGWNIDDVQIYGTSTGTSIPAPPSGLAVVALSSASTQISWQDKSNNEQGFAIERKTGTSGAWVEVARAGANVSSYVDSGLTGSTIYTYRCRAYNASGYSAYSNEGVITTPSSGGDPWDPTDNASTGATALLLPTSAEQSHGEHTLSSSDLADWFRVSLTAGTSYNFNSVGGTGDSYGELYSDSAGTVLVASDDDSGGSQQFSFTYTPSVAGYYYLKVRAYTPGQAAAYNLKYRSITSGGTVPNDAFSNSTAIPSDGTYTGTNVGATKEAGEPNHAGNSGGKSVWWRWTAPASGQCTIDTSGSSFDTILGVYTGISVSALTEIASNDDDPSGGTTSKVTFNAVAGTSYMISVDGYSGESGSITLHLAQVFTPTRILSVSGNLAFGNVNIGSSVTAAMTISNTGNTALTIAGIYYPYGFTGNWAGGTIAPGASQLVTVTFSPAWAGSTAGPVTVYANQTSGANTIQASGTGVTVPTRTIALSGNLAFGNVNIGSPATGYLYISNTGNTALTVFGITYPAGFTGNWAGGTVAPGWYQVVAVTFNPTTAGISSGAVTVNANQTSGTNSITASGTGVTVPTRILSLSGNLAFGNVNIGSPGTATMTISNTGNTAMTVYGIYYPYGFSGNWAGGTIAPGASQLVTVTFNPTWAGSTGGPVAVYANQTSGANSIQASGTGVTVPTRVIVLSGNLAFGNVNIGSPATAYLYISNTGNTAMTVSGITYPAGFTGNWAAGTIAPGGYQMVAVTFNPTSAGISSGAVTVNANQTGGTNSITASGTGVTVPTRILSLSGNLAFGNVNIGSPGTATMTIRNTGNTAMTVYGIYYPYGFSGNWAGGTIAAGGSQVVTVTFNPTWAGSTGGPVAVYANQTSGANSIQASGTGVTVPTRVIALSGNLAFGNVNIGSPATGYLYISNTGNTAMTVSGITYPAGFTGNWAGGTIAPGGYQVVAVTFNPTSATSVTGAVTVNANQTSGTNSITASGTGVTVPTRILSLSGNLTFGNVNIGSNRTATMTIRNAGNTVMSVAGIYYPYGFTGNWTGGTIAAGGSQVVTVTFSPAWAMNLGGPVTVYANQTSGANSIQASGTGVTVPTRVIALSGNLAFGNVNIGSPATGYLYISNTGNTALAVSGITYPAGFTGNWAGGTIAPGWYQTVVVTFNPTSATSVTGAVTVNANQTSGTNSITASGTGVTVPTRIISLSGNLTFGTVNIGSSGNATMTIRNTGNTALTVYGIYYPYEFTGNWAGGTIAPGASQLVTVTFSPAWAMNLGGPVTVYANQTGGAISITASGTGRTVP